MPDGDPITPDGDPITPDGDPITPDGDPITPDGDPITPDGDPITPGGDPITPGSVITEAATLKSAVRPDWRKQGAMPSPSALQADSVPLIRSDRCPREQKTVNSKRLVVTL